MGILTFPCENEYFKLALSALLDDGGGVKHKKEMLLVICLASWSLKEVIDASWIKSWSASKILIVSEKRFFPLAKYLQLRNRDLIEICSTGEFYSVFRCYMISGQLGKICNPQCLVHLTDMEYISLRRALGGESVHWQALRMGVSCKTVFSHRATAARKFGLKKISHITSTKILNLS